MNEDLPAKIGNYSVIDRLGRGAFGKVFSVRCDEIPKGEFAMKIIYEKFTVSLTAQTPFA